MVLAKPLFFDPSFSFFLLFLSSYINLSPEVLYVPFECFDDGFY